MRHALDVGSRSSVLRSVLHSGVLRRIQFAFLVFNISEWATWLAIIVYAYGRGGAAEAGFIAFIQLVPSVVVAPGASALGDRYPRARVLFGSYLLQAAAMAVTAVALATGEAIVVYVLATLTATSITLTRPLQGALLPEVVEAPDELTAANVASGMMEGAGHLIGPMLAGLLLALGGPELVFVATAIGSGLGAIALLPIARRSPARSMPVTDDGEPADPGGFGEGIRTVLADGQLRAIAVVLAFALGLVGALDIFYAVLAIQTFGLGDSGVGYLGAATGLGVLIGSLVAVILVGRDTLTGPLLVSAALFGGAIGAISLAPSGAVAAVLLVVAGVATAVVYVVIQTMTQRIAGDDVMTRVFGVEEAIMMAAQALGALVVPVLLTMFGTSGALVVAGLALPIAALIVARPLIRFDQAGWPYTVEVRTLRRVPMFMPLAAPVLERLATGSTMVAYEPQEVVIAQGDIGEAFYVIASGSVTVSVDGVSRGTRAGIGESFGEIALLHDVPRTATVVAAEPLEVVVIDREPFLDALSGQRRSHSMATMVASEHLDGHVSAETILPPG